MLQMLIHVTQRGRDHCIGVKVDVSIRGNSSLQ